MSLVFPSYSWCQTFKEFEERAQLLYKNGDLELAIIEYSKALLFFPKNPIAYYNRGVYNLEFYELETAIIDFKKSIKYDFPEPAYPLTNIGTCFSELGNLDSALVYFDQSLEIEPEFFSVLKDKVLVLFKLGKLDQAIENFNQALKIEPKYAAALAGRGQVFQDLGELKKAEKDYSTAISLDKTSYDSFNNRGNVRKELGNIEDAIIDYEKAIELYPEYFLTYFNLGVIFGNVKDYDKAVWYYSKSIELNPYDESSYLNRGAARAQSQKKDYLGACRT